jgi:hypothetical protein
MCKLKFVVLINLWFNRFRFWGKKEKYMTDNGIEKAIFDDFIEKI